MNNAVLARLFRFGAALLESSRGEAVRICGDRRLHG
jgi:hypothetical protein